MSIHHYGNLFFQSSSTNILGLVAFSLVFGVAIAATGAEGKPVLDFFTSFVAIMMKITGWIINLAPIGVLFLVAGSILDMKDVGKTFASLGWYFGTVLLGLGIHGIIVLPAIYGIFTRSWPFRYVINMGHALATAFGTASSAATLPVTIEALETKNKIDPRITRFILPIGATINMDGTALYEAVAAIFIAQVRGITLDAGQVVAISITATAASIGAAGIPQAGLVTMVMVLQTVGLPSTDVALIFAVDWLLDRYNSGYSKDLIIIIWLFCAREVERAHSVPILVATSYRAYFQVPNGNQCTWRRFWRWNCVPLV